jgi:ferredoxin
MTVEKYYISREHWVHLLVEWMRKTRMWAPQSIKERLYLQPIDSTRIPGIVLDGARAVESLKPFLFPIRESMSLDMKEDERPQLFLGVRACDLAALAVLDRILAGQHPHSPYTRRRDSALLVSADCTHPYRTCFCTGAGGRPHAAEGFDLNVSKIWDGFVIEVGSEAGKSLLEGFDRSLKPLVKEEAETQRRLREETFRRVQKVNGEIPVPSDSIGLPWDSPAWKKQASGCVECGACNFVCPTCHSFLLAPDAAVPSRIQRLWDACMLPGFDRLADGWTARPARWNRLRHRIFCKFAYQADPSGRFGCTGCGRCIEACPADIDHRDLMRELQAMPQVTAPPREPVS